MCADIHGLFLSVPVALRSNTFFFGSRDFHIAQAESCPLFPCYRLCPLLSSLSTHTFSPLHSVYNLCWYSSGEMRWRDYTPLISCALPQHLQWHVEILAMTDEFADVRRGWRTKHNLLSICHLTPRRRAGRQTPKRGLHVQPDCLFPTLGGLGRIPVRLQR